MNQIQLRAKIQSDPVWFINTVLKGNLWGKQEDIVRSVFHNSNTTARACHAPGKTFCAGNIVLTFLFAYPNSIVITTAPTWRQVEDMIWKEVRSAYNRSKLDLGGDLLKTRYSLGPDHYAVGLSTDEPDKFQGYHAPHILLIVDESSGVQSNLFEAIEGIGSTGHVRKLELGNPTDPTGHFSGTFKSQFYTKISISCFDTPNFKRIPSVEALKNSTPAERQKAVTHPYLITPQWVYERLEEWGENSPMFQARCLGEFPTEGEDTLIPLRYALAATERTEPLGDQTYEALGVDVAEFGSDKTVFVHRRGSNTMSLIRYSKAPLMETVGRVVEFHRLHPYATVNVDGTGVGAGVVSRLEELGIPVNRVMFGGGSNQSELFSNIKAEYFSTLAARFEAGDISIPSDDLLISELTSIKYKFTSRGQRQIESKEDMKKRGLKSPDSADAVMLAFAPVQSNAWLEIMKEKSN